MVEQPVRGDGGAAVRAARKQAGVTLRRLAADIGVSVGTMSAIENGKVGLTVERLQQIARSLDVPPGRLLAPPAEPVAAAPPGTGDWRYFGPLDLDPVLRSAIEVFDELGYHGATMRLIAAGADISVAGIYHHYPSKQRILVALLDLAHEDLDRRLTEAGEDPDPLTAFSQMVEAFTLFHIERRRLASIMVTEMRRVEEPDRSRLTASTAGWQDRLTAAARRAAGVEVSGSDGFEVATAAIIGMCLAVPYWTPADSDGRSLARQYAGLALGMIGHPTGA